jgi:NAD(P)-dependent dehydrogenase (short-subunit alcohol dehydrogenase family)
MISDELKDKVAIVTGGASGMGLGTVELFVKQGCKVVIADIQEERGHAAAAALGPRAAYRRMDVSNRADVAALVEFTVQHFGRLDVMFNNAGLMASPGTNDVSEDDFADFERTMAVDLLGVMLGTRYAAQTMRSFGGGAIINTASTTATVPGLGILSYRAAKAGVLNFTQNAAISLGRYGIRVNAISPGPIATDVLTMGLDLPPQKKEQVKLAAFTAMMQDRQPLKRLGMPVDIANAALFLASERSAQITGINLIVSGGEHVGDAVDSSKVVREAVSRAMTS